MAKKEEYISFITDKLRQGIVIPDKIMAEFVIKFQKTDRTFFRYWKIAQKKHNEIIHKKEQLKDEIYIEKEKEAFELALNDKNCHAKELIDQIDRLKEITAGKAIKVGGQIIVATFGDELRAKAEIRAIRTQIGKWYGFDAPVKKDITTDGKPLQQEKQTIEVTLNI